MEQPNSNINSKFDINFYNLRYQMGYMDAWPIYKTKRVYNYLLGLKSIIGNPTKILDFGGGTGVFSEVLSTVFPQAIIFLSDLSEEAIQIAKDRNSSIKGISLDELSKQDLKFDLIFSHHVLEHVDNLESTLLILKSSLEDSGSMVHILPSGNKGSLEYELCTWQKSGFRGEHGDLFYFDEEAHLRRLTSKGLNELQEKLGLKCVNEKFANHNMGTLIIFGSYKEKLLNTILNPELGKDDESKKKIIEIKTQSYKIKQSREVFEHKLSEINKQKVPFIQKIILFVKKIISGNSYLKFLKKEEEEWNRLQNNPDGSEMYLVYKFKNKA